MGKVEDAVRKKVRRTRINSAIVATLAISGGLAITVLAPNVLGALGKSGLLPQRRQTVKRSLTRLIEGGYVMLEHGRARLTSKGEVYAALLGKGKLAPKKPRRWDGKWRVLIFDIPERKKIIRAQIRKTLMRLGFMRLQNSVWIYPYDCEDVITLFKVDLKIGKDLLYMVVDKLEFDVPLRRHFSLR